MALRTSSLLTGGNEEAGHARLGSRCSATHTEGSIFVVSSTVGGQGDR